MAPWSNVTPRPRCPSFPRFVRCRGTVFADDLLEDAERLLTVHSMPILRVG
jgi:hypothetical protein